MSDQGLNKVDLSLDDIIKLNKKERQQYRGQGGAGRGRGAARGRGRGAARGRGQGLQGQRTRGVGRGGSGARPLDKQNTGTGSATGALRGQGQGGRRGGQRGNRRGLAGRWGGLQGGLNRGGHGGLRGQVTTTGGVGVRGSRGNLRVRGTRSNLRGTPQSGRGNLRGMLRGARGNLRGRLRGRGSATIQGQGQGRGAVRQGEGRGAMNRVSLKQKRELAVQTLHLARKTIAQLDQQTARQNFVNARRGIVQQQPPLNAKNNQELYSSTMSLTPAKSTTPLTSTRQLQGTQVTTFNPVRSQQNPRGRRRWRPQAQTNLPINKGSTLTISIDNSTPLSTPDFSSPQVTDPLPSAPHQRQRLRRRPWQRQNRNSNINIHNNNPATAADVHEFRAGASPEFSQQLMDMKPTVSTNYVFEKRAFSTANTSCSLNDRFSGNSADSLMGRKVFL